MVAPDEVSGSKVILFTAIDKRHRPTGNCRHTVDGKKIGIPAAVAICRYDGASPFYLFGCDTNWNVLTLTSHESLDSAQEQAEFEYEGITDTWQVPERPEEDR